ncbi:MAG: carboxypeptidase M32 [Synergistaceae bacterium]|jgi:carboxypeptidase Taq|nr:carboxypeptidase M32 [Synergistaceae bacterium]
MKKDDTIGEFRKRMKEINHIHCLEEALMWDTRVNLPPRGANCRGEIMGYLAGRKFAMKTSRRMKYLLGELSDKTFDDGILNRMISIAGRDYGRMAAIPSGLSAEYAEHVVKTELIWQEARVKNDYDMVKGALKKSFDYKREFARYYGYGDRVMDSLLNEWEEGCDTKMMDAIFEDLKAYILPLLDRVRASGGDYSRGRLKNNYPRDVQFKFINDVTAAVGYDHEAGSVAESAHPFTFRLCPRDDIRFTTTIRESDFSVALLSSMHESGHAMYGQNIAPELRGTMLGMGASWGIDEGQARFFENIAGRSFEFWKRFYPLAQKYFPSLTMGVEDFYRNLNAVSFSPIRLEADEITYNLHIIIRYELEKRYYDECIGVDELPALWADKYEEYLGIRPQNYAEGILQDVQWFSGWIGYYQNYVLANCYDGHFLASLQKSVPDFWKQIGRGEFGEINAWHNENVRRYGALYPPAEILRKFSGETLSAGHYIDYLKRKFEPLVMP